MNELNKLPQSFSRKNYLITHSAVISFFRAVGAVIGIALDGVMVFYYGASFMTDALFLALTIPLLLSSILDIQLPKVLVPICVKGFQDTGKEATRRFMLNLLNFSLIALTFLSLLWMGLAFWIVPLQGMGYESNVLQVAVRLSLLLGWIVLLRGTSAILCSYLNVYHHFLTPAASKCIINIVTILMVIFFHQRFSIYAFAMGRVLGFVAAIGILIPVLIAKGFQYRFVLDLKDSQLRRVLKLLAYPFAGHGIYECRIVIENFLASFMPEGVLTSYRIAYRIIQTGVGLVVGGTITATLPLVSHFSSIGDLDKMKESLKKGIQLMCLLAFPIGVWLMATHQPLLSLLLERGRFTPDDVALTGFLMALLVPGILFGRINAMLQNSFLSQIDVRTPTLINFISFLTFSIVLSLIVQPLGVHAFPVSFAVAALIALLIIIRLFNRRFGSLEWAKSGSFFTRLILATLVAAGGFLLGITLTHEMGGADLFSKSIRFLIPSSFGWSMYFISAGYFRLYDWKDLLRITRKIGARFTGKPKATHP